MPQRRTTPLKSTEKKRTTPLKKTQRASDKIRLIRKVCNSQPKMAKQDSPLKESPPKPEPISSKPEYLEDLQDEFKCMNTSGGSPLSFCKNTANSSAKRFKNVTLIDKNIIS
jgi:hypothetical protein